jgi:hypothetical protein
MVDSLTFLAAAPVVTPAAPAAVAAAVVEFASPPPPSLLATGGVIAATVVGRDGESVLVLRTDFGTLALKTLLALDPGTSVELKLFAGPPAGAAILSADGAPLGFGALRAAATPGSLPAPVAALPAEAAPTVVELGQTVRATVVTAATTPGAPAAGSELALRLVSAPAVGVAGSPATLLATIVQSGGPTTLVDSALGRLALDAQIDLAVGAPLILERLAAPARAGLTAAPTATSTALGTGWPALDDALAALDRAAPDLAAQMRTDLAPSAAPRLTAALLFFMGVLQGEANWPGDPVGLALTAAGRSDLRARLAKDVSDLRQQASESARGDWRIFTLPVLDEAAVQPIRLYVRNPRDESHGGGQSQQGARFVLDLDLSRLGPLQLDGLVRGARFDLVLRSHDPLDSAMKGEIGTLFHSALDGSGFSGDVAFVTTAKFPVSPLDALRPHLGIRI